MEETACSTVELAEQPMVRHLRSSLPLLDSLNSLSACAGRSSEHHKGPFAWSYPYDANMLLYGTLRLPLLDGYCYASLL